MEKPQIPIGDALPEVRVPPLAEGHIGKLAFVLVKVVDADGEEGWAVRTSEDLDEDELLGVLVSYTHQVKVRKYQEWMEFD